MDAIPGTTEPSGPLSKVAGGGNDLQTQAFQKMLDRADANQSYADQQRAAYNASMEDYARMVQQSLQPENQAAGRWGAMATAASKYAPTWGNIAPGLAAVGGAAGEQAQLQQMADLKAQRDLTQTRQAEVRALEAKGQNAAMLKAMSPAKSNWIQFKDDAGNLHLMDKSVGPGSETVVPATQSKQWLALIAQGQEIAVKQDEPDKAQFALDYAVRMMPTLRRGVASATAAQPATESVGPRESVSLSTQQQTQPPTTAQPNGGAVSVAPSLMQLLTPADQATATRLVARINANPVSAPNDLKTLEAIIAKYDERNTKAPSVTAQSQALGTESNSIAAAAGRKAQAEADVKLGIAKELKAAEAQGTGEGKQAAEAPEKKTILENYLAEAAQTRDVVDGLLGHPGLEKASGIEGYIPGRGRVTPIAGSDSAEFINALKTLESRVTSLALQNARVGSSSGATGFGALDAGEREMLRDSMASLSLQQSPEKLKASLQKVRDIVAASERRANEGYARTYASGAATGKPDAAYQAWKAKRGLK